MFERVQKDGWMKHWCWVGSASPPWGSTETEKSVKLDLNLNANANMACENDANVWCGTFVHYSAFAESANRPCPGCSFISANKLSAFFRCQYIAKHKKINRVHLHQNILYENFLWSTDSWWIVFGCLSNIGHTVECCLPHLGNIYIKGSLRFRMSHSRSDVNPALASNSFHGHLMPSTKNDLRYWNTHILIIPGGMTHTLQPLDVSINKPVKDGVCVNWNECVVNGECSFTKGGSMQAPTLFDAAHR